MKLLNSSTHLGRKYLASSVCKRASCSARYPVSVFPVIAYTRHVLHDWRECGDCRPEDKSLILVRLASFIRH